MTTTPDIIRPQILGVEGMELTQHDFVMPFGNIDRFTGKIINSLSETELLAEFIPLKFWHRYSKFVKSKLEWGTLTPTKEQEKECEFGPNGEPPTADKTLQVLCLFKDEDMPVIITFKRTSYRVGKTLLTMATTGVKIGVFEKKFALSTEAVTNDSGQKYFRFKVKPVGRCTEEEISLAKSLQDMFKEHAVKAEETTTDNMY